MMPPTIALHVHDLFHVGEVDAARWLERVFRLDNHHSQQVVGAGDWHDPMLPRQVHRRFRMDSGHIPTDETLEVYVLTATLRIAKVHRGEEPLRYESQSFNIPGKRCSNVDLFDTSDIKIHITNGCG